MQAVSILDDAVIQPIVEPTYGHGPPPPSSLPSLRVIGRPTVCLQRPGYRVVKRLLDVALCLIALPIVLPVLAICAVLIWLDDPGPVLFTQWRTGRRGTKFRMYKLRTMVRDAEQRKTELAEQNELSWPDYKISDDPRVTRLGRILRKTSLDELPQVFNVIKGDMSLVGPRPTSFDLSTYSLWHTERLEVLPGITGLWQISGRSNLDFDQRVRLDIEYLKRQNLREDLMILLRTVAAVVSRRGAY